MLRLHWTAGTTPVKNQKTCTINVYSQGDISGDEMCAGTNGLNREQFDGDTTQLNLTYQLTDNIELKYIFGFNELIYRRTTDDDNTASRFHDRQFYVNHEASYESHEVVAFIDLSESVTLTSGVFFYDAQIDQRGDYYSAVGQAKYIEPSSYLQDKSGVSEAMSAAIGGAIPAGTPATALLGVGPMVTLHSARDSCAGSTAFGCNRNDGLIDPDAFNIQCPIGMVMMALIQI